MKKITVNKSDEASVIVEKIIEADSHEVVLNIPRFSHLAESLSNFHLLKREAEALGKKILIESIDDRVIELAELSGLRAINPFFAKSKKQFSDIVPPTSKKGYPAKGPQAAFLSAEAPSAGSGQAVEKPKKRGFSRFLKLPKLPKLPKLALQLPKSKITWKILLIIALAAASLWIILQELPRASVALVVKKAEWSYNDSIMTANSAKVDSGALTVPNQIFIQKKNAENKFPATGRKQVEKSAAGKIIVYNGYSSDPQPLIAKTRFVTPEGKTFLLTKGITVPGAAIVEGKIVPSSIEANVIADKPGPDYNIGPVKLFTIPGLKSTPKYKAFYGESREAMSGGYIGEVAYPIKADIDAAKLELSRILEDNLKAAVYSQVPTSFKILGDAVKFEVLKYSVNEEVDKENKFSVFAEAKITLIGFKEEDVLKILSKRAAEEIGLEFEVQNTELEYGLARADFQGGKMSFLVNFKAHLRHRIDVEALRNRIIGKSEDDLRAIIFSLPGVESAAVSLWPFWVNKVPIDPDRVKIVVD